jgi:hypothetical protein
LIQEGHSGRPRLVDPQAGLAVVHLGGVLGDFPRISKELNFPALFIVGGLFEEIIRGIDRLLAETHASKGNSYEE